MVSFGVKIMRTSARKDEEETVVDGRTGGLMGKPGTRISDPRFIQDMISLFFTIS